MGISYARNAPNTTFAGSKPLDSAGRHVTRRLIGSALFVRLFGILAAGALHEGRIIRSLGFATAETGMEHKFNI
jgi:hypothetical protein